MSEKAFEITQGEASPQSTAAFSMSEGTSESALNADIFNESILSNRLEVNGDYLDKAQMLRGEKVHSIPIPEESDLSADMPEDKVLQEQLKGDIKFNRDLAAQQKAETLSNVFSAALRGLLSKKQKNASTMISQLHHNNVTAIERANMINKAIVTHQNSNLHLTNVLKENGIKMDIESIKKAAKEDVQVAEALKISQAARANLVNQIASPESQRSIKIMKDSGLLGSKAERNLDSALKSGAKELEKDNANKFSLEGMSEKMDEVMSSISDFIDDLFSRPGAGAKPS